MQKDIDKAKASAKWWEEQAQTRREQRDAAQRSANALKGVVTKVKKRIGNGVCPCCERTFSNLARHMTCKHPQYVEESRG